MSGGLSVWEFPNTVDPRSVEVPESCGDESEVLAYVTSGRLVNDLRSAGGSE